MATNELQIDLPHRLGRAEAKSRIDGGLGRLKDFVPGAAEVRSAWTEDRLGLQVVTLGQEVNAQIDVADDHVHVEILLPPALAWLGGAIEAALARRGREMLEDRRPD